MTVGSGILWSTTLIVFVFVAYQLSVRRKWRVVGKILGGLIILGVMVAGSFWTWNRYENRPKAVDALDGVRLGMTPLDVRLAKGAPKNEAEATVEKSDDRDYVLRWLFNENPYDPNLVAIFYGKESNNLKVSIVCEIGGDSKVLGFGRSDSEEDVTARLGQPSKTSIAKDGLEKLISFKRYKVAFAIAKGRVTEVCVTASGSVTYAEEYQAESAQKPK